MEKLNVTIQEGYPSHSSETAGLSRDQFVKPPKTLKWYEMYSEKKDFSCSRVHSWTNEPARLNSSFPRIASHSLHSALTSRTVSHDTLRRQEWAACDQSYQAAGLIRCLTKVQESMVSQLKVIHGDKFKGKSSGKFHQAAEEFDYLIMFKRSITQAMAWTM